MDDLIITEQFDTTSCEFYQDSHDEVWLTREQVGSALGYADPAKSIQNIHLKHKDRLDKFVKRERVKTAEIRDSLDHPQSDGSRRDGSTKPFSKNDNLQSEVVFYSERGVMEICRWSDMPKANEFMDWVWNIVEGYRHNKVIANKKAIELLNNQIKEQGQQFNLLAERVEQLGKLTQDSNKEIMARLDVLESSSTVATDGETEWARKMQPRVNALAERYTHGDSGKCMDRLIERAEELGMPDSYEELKAYYAVHHDGKRAKKILIMAQFEESRDPFERALIEFEKEWGLYKQIEQQKQFEKLMDGFGIEVVSDPPEYSRHMTNEELEAEYEALTKMYGEGWDTNGN